MKTLQFTVAVSLLALLVSITWAAPKAKPQPACAPANELTRAQLTKQCGKPQATYKFDGAAGLYEEWQYGETYVGLLNGRVWYVL